MKNIYKNLKAFFNDSFKSYSHFLNDTTTSVIVATIISVYANIILGLKFSERIVISFIISSLALIFISIYLRIRTVTERQNDIEINEKIKPTDINGLNKKKDIINNNYTKAKTKANSLLILSILLLVASVFFIASSKEDKRTFIIMNSLSKSEMDSIKVETNKIMIIINDSLKITY